MQGRFCRKAAAVGSNAPLNYTRVHPLPYLITEYTPTLLNYLINLLLNYLINPYPT
jgi:hypothetical protein